VTRLPSLTPRQLIRALKRAGFRVINVEGSHYSLSHPTEPSVVITVAYHNKDLKRGTLMGILKQAGLSTAEFQRYL
jgi:predicted RNA binding protein YcfA (HicA-like mRNA interferase family)